MQPMESEAALNHRILLVTNKIKEDFPELTKFLDELPEHTPTNKGEGVSRKDLKDYLDSLNELLDNYAKEH